MPVARCGAPHKGGILEGKKEIQLAPPSVNTILQNLKAVAFSLQHVIQKYVKSNINTSVSYSIGHRFVQDFRSGSVQIGATQQLNRVSWIHLPQARGHFLNIFRSSSAVRRFIFHRAATTYCQTAVWHGRQGLTVNDKLSTPAKKYLSGSAARYAHNQRETSVPASK